MAEYTRNVNPANDPFTIYYKLIWGVITLGVIGFFVIFFCGSLFNIFVYLSNKDQDALFSGIMGLICSIPLALAALVSAILLFRKPKDKYSGEDKELLKRQITVENKDMTASSFTTYESAAITLTRPPKDVNSVHYWLIDAEGVAYRIDREMYKNVGIGDTVDIEYHLQNDTNYVVNLKNEGNPNVLSDNEFELQEKAIVDAAFQRGGDRRLVVLLIISAVFAAVVILTAFIAIAWRVITLSLIGA